MNLPCHALSAAVFVQLRQTTKTDCQMVLVNEWKSSSLVVSGSTFSQGPYMTYYVFFIFQGQFVFTHQVNLSWVITEHSSASHQDLNSPLFVYRSHTWHWVQAEKQITPCALYLCCLPFTRHLQTASLSVWERSHDADDQVSTDSVRNLWKPFYAGLGRFISFFIYRRFCEERNILQQQNTANKAYERYSPFLSVC